MENPGSVKTGTFDSNRWWQRCWTVSVLMSPFKSLAQTLDVHEAVLYVMTCGRQKPRRDRINEDEAEQPDDRPSNGRMCVQRSMRVIA